MESEVEFGNVEYKRKLSSNRNERYKTLITQMLWRLNEGNGEAIYYLGVNDDGTIYNFKNIDEERDTIFAFRLLTLRANVKIVSIKQLFNKNVYYKVVIHSENNIINEKKIILLGDPNTGKTTYMSFLLHGEQDDGNGYLRNKIFNHDHEINSGNTCTINVKSMGINDNTILNYRHGIELFDIKKNSTNIITFFDIPNAYIINMKYVNILKCMDCAIIMTYNGHVDKYVNICNSYKIPYMIIHNTNDTFSPINLKLYTSIISRPICVKGVLLLNIISYSNDEYLICCLNNGEDICIGKKIFFFEHMEKSTFATIKSMRYFNKHISIINKNVTFTMVIQCKENIKKYKRKFFYVF